jgi:hypothetical protein
MAFVPTVRGARFSRSIWTVKKRLKSKSRELILAGGASVQYIFGHIKEDEK